MTKKLQTTSVVAAKIDAGAITVGKMELSWRKGEQPLKNILELVTELALCSSVYIEDKYQLSAYVEMMPLRTLLRLLETKAIYRAERVVLKPL